MINLSSFSQTDTTKVTFRTKTVREIAKELVQKDGLEKENKFLYSQLDLHEKKDKLQDSVISNYKKLDDNNQKVIKNKDSEIDLYKENESIYKKENKTLKKKNWFWKGTTGLTVVVLIVSIFK